MDCALLPGLLAEELVARSHPGIERVLFTNSGAEAIESAIKFARAATRRTRILYCDHAFHGLTTGALALNGGHEFRSGFGPLLPGCDMVPFGDTAALARELRRGDVAAFVVEPIQGKGVNVASDDFWAEAQSLCRRHKTLLVLDEVQTGIGRCRHLPLPRAISGSCPTSSRSRRRSREATCRWAPCSARPRCPTASSVPWIVRWCTRPPSARTNRRWWPRSATLQVFEDEDILDRVQRTGKAFTKALQPLVEQYEFLHKVRGRGLMIGLVFGMPASPALRRRYRMIEALRPALFSQMIVVPLFHRHRILTQVAADNMNVVKLLPPLIAGDDEVEQFADALDDVLASAQRGSGLIWEFGKTMAKGTLHRSRL